MGVPRQPEGTAGGRIPASRVSVPGSTGTEVRDSRPAALDSPAENGAGGRLPARPSLSVVVPVFNEEAGLVASVDALRAGAARAVEDFEVVLVDDASTDGTPEVARGLHRQDPRVRVVRLERNGRLGTALRAGFQAARGDVVLYADADLPFDPEEIARALRLMRLHEADLVCAWRFDRTSEGLRRTLYSVGYNALVALLFGVHVRDVNFSFKLIRRSLLERLPLESRGSFIDAELVIRATRAGARIIQFGTDYFPRQHGASRLSDLGTVGAVLGEMIRFRLRGRP